MTDHAHELRRYARKIAHPAGDVPAVMRAAADEIERLRTESAGLVDDMNLLRDNNTALRAKVEAMEKQEPVAIAKWTTGGVAVHLVGDARPGDILYLAPSAQPAPSVPEGWKLAPIEVVDLYSFMCSAFTPMTPQQDQIAIQLDLAKRAMLTSSLGLVDQAMTRSAAIRARGESDAP